MSRVFLIAPATDCISAINSLFRVPVADLTSGKVRYIVGAQTDWMKKERTWSQQEMSHLQYCLGGQWKNLGTGQVERQQQDRWMIRSIGQVRNSNATGQCLGQMAA